MPLIPKYFDLLHLLVVRRQEAVAKEVIFAEVWSDVVVTDGALSQAVRTLRRTLGDDVREPRFIRTVSRHGYQFVWADVIEESDTDRGAVGTAGRAPASATPLVATGSTTPIDSQAAAAVATETAEPSRAELAISVEPGPRPEIADPRLEITETVAASERIDRLASRLLSTNDPEEARDVAEQLHALGTGAALERLTALPNHGPALAVMRDTRWNVPGAGEVPLLGDSEAARAIATLIRLRLADVRRVVALRWAGAAGAGALGGAAAGLLGGIALTLAPLSNARPHSSIALALIGAVAGAIGAGGVAAGLIAAEVLARSRRTLALVACGAVAGAIVGAIASMLLRLLLESLFGLHLGLGSGAIDGLVLGAAAGFGYGMATAIPAGGMAAPHGSRRLAVALAVASACAMGAIALAVSGQPLVGGLIHEIARASQNAELVLSPLGRLIGEPDFETRAQILLSAFEGAAFGGSLALGLTHRPKIARPR